MKAMNTNDVFNSTPLLGVTRKPPGSGGEFVFTTIALDELYPVLRDTDSVNR
jgi:hypothetical protein